MNRFEKSCRLAIAVLPFLPSQIREDGKAFTLDIYHDATGHHAEYSNRDIKVISATGKDYLTACSRLLDLLKIWQIQQKRKKNASKKSPSDPL